MQRWLHVGGHAGTGETSASDVALQEAWEETSLPDLSPWPDAARPLLVHVVVVPVPAEQDEPEHEHANLRYLLATAWPEEARAETAAARLRWLSIANAMAAVAEDNLRVTFERSPRSLPSTPAEDANKAIGSRRRSAHQVPAGPRYWTLGRVADRLAGE
jgi:8-oxo-dGTP pyrophosphatase MutT (NUDIX family)